MESRKSLKLGRRQFVQALGSGYVSGCCTKPVPVERAHLNGVTIDAHCHVFNAADLPARDFILGTQELTQALLRDPTLQTTANFIVDSLLTMLDAAPTAAQEKAFLSNQRRADAQQDPLDAWDSAVDEFLVDMVAETPPVGSRSWTANYDLVHEPERQNLGALLRQSGVLEQNLGGSRLQATGGSTIATDIFLLMDWCRQLCNYRIRNVDRIMEILGPENRGPAIFLPALVDLFRWLPDIAKPTSKAPRVPLAEQVDIMEEVAKLRPGVHPFLGVDPLADWAETEALLRRCFARSDGSCNGFVGVKLYPPMGFSPSNNEHLVALDSKLEQVDVNLGRLYRFCDEYDVPIMAHCNLSKETVTGHQNKTGAAKEWEPVVRQYGGLRINLAHFGGVENFTHESAQSAVPQEQEDIAALMELGRVFADIADDTTPSVKEERPAVIAAFRAYFSRHPLARQRLMYGSDWILLGYERSASLNYLGGWSAVMDALGSASGTSAFFGQNALTFLGWAQPGLARTRIERFYDGIDRQVAWLPEPGDAG